MKFSPGTGSFYPDDIHYPNPPADLLAVTMEEYNAAMARGPGETLGVVDGRLVVVAAPVPDAVAVLAAAKAGAWGRIAGFAQGRRQAVAGTQDAAQMAAWANKLRVAQAVVAGSATVDERAVLEAEVAARGIAGETPEALAAKVVAKATRFAKAVGCIDGFVHRAQEAVAGAAGPQEVEAALSDMQNRVEETLAELAQPQA